MKLCSYGCIDCPKTSHLLLIVVHFYMLSQIIVFGKIQVVVLNAKGNTDSFPAKTQGK